MPNKKFLRSIFFGYKKEKEKRKKKIDKKINEGEIKSQRSKEAEDKEKEEMLREEKLEQMRQNEQLLKIREIPYVNAFEGSKPCPFNILKVLLKQTSMDENTIHSKYVKFKEEYPSGFIGRTQLQAENKHDELVVDAIFDLYAQNTGAWGMRLIGFREMIIASEMRDDIQKPESILQWLFRIFDVHGEGKIKCKDIANILQHIIGLCIHSDDNNKTNEILNDLIRQFDTFSSQDTISEEEFIYDALRIKELHDILENSVILEAETNSEEK